MTIEKFLERHSGNWEAFKRDPMFIDLIAVAHEYAPYHRVINVSTPECSANSQFILGTISGFASFQDLMENQITTSAKIVPPETAWIEE